MSAQIEADVITRLVDRIVRAVGPLRIILFGSTVKGGAGPNSDLDVLVVMPDGTHRLDTARHLYQELSGVGIPVDIIVATPEILERHRNNIGLIYRTVLLEGKEIYVA